MSGPVETELPPSAFRRRDKLRLTLTMNNRTVSEPEDLKSQVRMMNCDELARKLNSCNNKHRLPFILLDCRGYLCYTDCHIRGAVHIACTDRFNRKRVQNAGSVLDLVSTNNRRNKTHNNAIYHNGVSGKYRDVIVYDEGTSDLNLDATWANPISFVLVHLLQENRQPIYLNGGMKEFTRVYRDLCDSSSNRKDLSIMSSTTTSPTSPFLPSPLCPPLSPSAYANIPPPPSTPRCIESYENEPPTQVLPFLYVGNARDAADSELLKRLRIRYVLSVTMSLPYNNKCPTPLPSPATTLDMSSSMCVDSQSELRTKLIPVSDNLCENLAPYFDEACDFIEEARKSGYSILIHCQAGISRSPTIAIAYIMKHIKLSTLEAYAFVQRSRRIISPNLNFMGQLVEFESKLKSSEDWRSSESSVKNLTSHHYSVRSDSEDPSSPLPPSSCSSSSSSASSSTTTSGSPSPNPIPNNCNLLDRHLSVNIHHNNSDCAAASAASTPMIYAD